MNSTDGIHSELKRTYIIGLIITSFIILAVSCGQLVSLHSPRFSAWIPFFFVGASAPLSYLFCQINMSFLSKTMSKKKWQLGIRLIYSVVLFFILYIDYRACKMFFSETKENSALYVFCLVVASSFLMLTFLKRDSIINAAKFHAGIFIALYIVLITSWCNLFQLTNWQQLIHSYMTDPLITAIATLSCVVFAIYYVLNPRLSLVQNKHSVLQYCYYSFVMSLTIALLVLLSFRHDTLFIGGSIYHWEYFVGPIRTLKQGGWLLWNIPSQYGFLNLLFPSLLPTSSSWQALYVFQAVLLFIVSTLMMHIIVINLQNPLRFITGLILVISSLYFADPDLIGPYLYPSSSVMRFFWCYIFLYLFFIYWRDETVTLKKFTCYGSLLWVLSVLWSAESAIYTTVTFYAAVFVALMQHFSQSPSNRNLVKCITYLFIPILMLIIVLIMINFFYHSKLGSFPDWSLLFIYGFSYAAGFGSLPLKVYGSVWLLILLFLGMVTVLINTALTMPHSRTLVALTGAVGCLWAISSYFIGRAAPQNITAILPILVTITGLALTICRHQTDFPALLLKCSTFPLFFIVLATTVANLDFINKLKYFAVFSTDLTKNIPLVKPDLQSLIDTVGITPDDPIAYFSYDGSIGRIRTKNGAITSELPWLSAPLQLLNEPISVKQRNLFITRFVANKLAHQSAYSGYLIHAKGEYQQQYVEWLDTIKLYFIPVSKHENNGWEITRFIIAPL